MKNAALRATAALGVTALLTGCLSTAPKMGDSGAKTVVTGAAGGGEAANANSAIQRCDKPFGTVALVEDQNSAWFRTLSEYKLGSTVPVIRLMVQQSNCFIVVERGRALDNMTTERALQQSGELRGGSSFGQGQMVAADYAITPEIIFDQKGTSGLSGMLGGFGAGVVGALAGGFRKNEAGTVLLLTDNRSGVQVSAAEGSASNTDFSLGGFGFGGSGFAGARGYTNTPQGKVIVAAFADAYNQMITSLRTYSAQTMGGSGLGTGGKLQVEGTAKP